MKTYKIKTDDLKELVPSMGGCIVSDLVSLEGMPIGFMYRDEPDDNFDSGWRFLSGTETYDFVNNPDNSGIFDVNTIANHDPSIMPYLNLPYNSELERIEGTDEFRPV